MQRLAISGMPHQAKDRADAGADWSAVRRKRELNRGERRQEHDEHS